MTGAMYAAIAGLKTHMNKMNVIGNNIANVNTAGFKSQRAIFKDAMYSTLSNGSNGTSTVGGKNPTQIGYGSQVSTIDLNMTTGTYTLGRNTDCMIYGDGFFLVGDKDAAATIDPSDPESLKVLKMTRVGDFEFKSDGYLCDGSGNPVYGFLTTGVDKDGKPIISDQLVPIRYPKALITYTKPDGQPGTKAEYDAAKDQDKWKISTEIKYPVVGKDTPNNPTLDKPLEDAKGPNGEELPYATFDSISVNPKTGAITGTSKDTEEPVVIGYLAIGNVTNPNGVSHTDGFYYTAGDGAGDLQISMLGGVAKDLGLNQVNGGMVNPNAQSNKMAIGSAGGTKLMTGGLEGSNVDLASEISEMITTQRGYQANTRIITVTDSMLEELVNMKR